MFNKSFKMSPAALQNGSDKNGNAYGGASFSNCIDPSKVKLEAWKPQEGRNLIDIIPFNATAENPLVVAGKAIEGEVLYSLDYYSHRDMGPTHSNIICLRQYGKECPICRENQRLFNSDNEKDKVAASKIRAKRRVTYVVHDLLHDKFGYWDNAWQTVEEQLTKEAGFTIDPNTGAKINVFDWKEGMSVEFQGTKDDWQGHSFIKPERFRFIARQPLSDKVLEHSVDLASTVKMTSAEDMEKILCNKPVQNTEAPAAAPVESKPVVEEPAPSMPVQEKSFDEMKPVEATENLAAQATSIASGTKCPCGFAWGDADKHSECGACKKWEDCLDGTSK